MLEAKILQVAHLYWHRSAPGPTSTPAVLWQPSSSPYRQEQLYGVPKVAKEGHDVHAFRQAGDLTEPDHEQVLIRKLVQRPLLFLVLADQHQLVFRGNETHQQLQKVKAQGLQIVPEGDQRESEQSQDAQRVQGWWW